MDMVINFFKEMNLYDEQLFKNLENRIVIFDKPYEEIKEFVGCYQINGEYKLILPKLNSELDTLVYIHEYTHAIFIDDKEEIFPNVMEAMYIKKYINDKKTLDQIKEKAVNIINNSNSDKHVVANKVKLKLISEEK